MPSFATPEPISLDVHFGVGEARLTATDRDDTVVHVNPSDPSNDADRRAAEQTRVERTTDGVLVKAPKQRGVGLFDKPGSVDVAVELPTGSRLRVEAGVGAVRCVGRVGDCHVTTGVGDVQLEQTGVLEVETGAGSVTVDVVAGKAEVTTGTGKISVRKIDGAAVLKNSNGDNWVGQVSGKLRATTANGDVIVEHVGGDVTAKSAKGDIRVGDVTRGSASLTTAFGQVEVGIHAGTAARLDVATDFGKVRNQMDAADGPGSTDQTADVHAHTTFGDIVIRRAVPA
jgi:DUF4097 and DUF4098 domain-containing protein YvlB